MCLKVLEKTKIVEKILLNLLYIEKFSFAIMLNYT